MKPNLVYDLAKQAQDIFHRNSDTMVAGYLIRHPDTDPADITLVFQTIDGVMRFSLEPKEMHVPPAKAVGGEAEKYRGSQAYLDGWNDCRQAMIAQATSVRAPDAIVSTLGDDHGI